MRQNVRLHLYQSSTTISIFSKKMFDDDGKLLIFHKKTKSFFAHFESTKSWNGLFTFTEWFNYRPSERSVNLSWAKTKKEKPHFDFHKGCTPSSKCVSLAKRHFLPETYTLLYVRREKELQSQWSRSNYALNESGFVSSPEKDFLFNKMLVQYYVVQVTRTRHFLRHW